MVENKRLYSIGVVERDTGIGRDILRVWQRRYGFPEPVRNEKGERIYSEMQLRRLQPEKPQELDETVSAILDAIHSADAGQVEWALHSVGHSSTRIFVSIFSSCVS